MRELTYFPLLEDYPISSPYGQRVDPITGAPGDWHRGVDYAAPAWAPVIAPYDGELTTGYEGGGAGNWLWVVNGGDMFKSFHHESFALTGGWVSAGTVLAYIGSTGASTGAHAHLELWDHGAVIDPTPYLDRAPLFGADPEGDEMTEADWNTMRGMLNTALVGKLAVHSTPQVLLSDAGGQFTVVVDGEGRLRKCSFASPDEVTLLQRIGFLAPQKPEHPPAPCPQALDVSALTAGERAALDEIPWSGS